MEKFDSWEKRIYQSDNIINSQIIVESENIKNSSHIFYSTNVEDSKDIVESDEVTNCKQVFLSSMIENSEKIAKSLNVSNSKNICESSMISESIDVFKSTNVFESKQIERSKNITDCFFVAQCDNLAHSLFCFDQHDNQHLLFNQPIDPMRFELIKKQYNKYFRDYLCFATGWYRELATAAVPKIHYNFNSHYNIISEKFWTWVESLPNFDKQILYSITINTRFL